MNDQQAHRAAHLILASRAIDQAFDRVYRLFLRARTELVLALASEATLDRFNELTYGSWDLFQTDSSRFRHRLFPWEEIVIERVFPRSPARILIGGAGGGREAFALARKGYAVTAFEPAVPLVEATAAHVSDGMPVQVYRAAYEELPALRPVRAGEQATSLEEISPFDAAIIGWGSFSHLRTEEVRVRTLQAFARATRGPLLVSFFFRPGTMGSATRTARFRRLLPSRLNREPGNNFSVYTGFCHHLDTAEITGLGLKAGLSLAHLSTENDDWAFPHAVFVPTPPSDTAAGLRPGAVQEAPVPMETSRVRQ